MELFVLVSNQLDVLEKVMSTMERESKVNVLVTKVR